MNRVDLIVLMSFVFTLNSIFVSFLRQKVIREKIFSISIILGFALLFLGIYWGDIKMGRALILGTIAGTLLQPMLADTYLTRKTLIYRKSKWYFLETPWWMALLWGIALSQLTYLGLRLEGVITAIWFRHCLFILIGSVYLYIFEWLVNNFTFWWKRKNCWQPFGVAFYATIAEIVAVIILSLLCSILIGVSLPWAILLSFAVGMAIAFVFRISCYIFYKREI